MYKAITYVGDRDTQCIKFNNSVYNFEWQKSLGIGSRNGEVHLTHAVLLSYSQDSNGKKVFILE